VLSKNYQEDQTIIKQQQFEVRKKWQEEILESDEKRQDHSVPIEVAF
jgi:hypothetical protein